MAVKDSRFCRDYIFKITSKVPGAAFRNLIGALRIHLKRRLKIGILSKGLALEVHALVRDRMAVRQPDVILC